MECVQGVTCGGCQLSQTGGDTCQVGVQKATCSKGQSQSLARQEDRQASTGRMCEGKGSKG